MYNSHNHTHAPSYTFTYNTHMHMHMYKHTHIHIYTHMHMYNYHTHTLTHTHTIAVGGVPIQQIAEYMRSNEAYRFCLSEFQTVSANHRNFFATFDDTATMASIEEAIANDPALRQFIG